jgi:hypothetical protein
MEELAKLKSETEKKLKTINKELMEGIKKHNFPIWFHGKYVTPEPYRKFISIYDDMSGGCVYFINKAGDVCENDEFGRITGYKVDHIEWWQYLPKEIYGKCANED